MKDILEWVEKAGLENIKGHLQAADELKKECNIALNVFLAGAAGALAYAAKAFESPTTLHIAFAASALSASLFVLCGTVLFKCLQVGDMPAPANEPKNLLQEDFSLEALREVELGNLQQRIEEASARNITTAYWLNRIRILAILSPIVPLLTIGFLAVARVS